MTIKIIKPPIAFVVDCTHCGCKFSYHYSDLVEHRRLVNRYKGAASLVVPCPGCNKLHLHDTYAVVKMLSD
jgi:hypothetical protein